MPSATTTTPTRQPSNNGDGQRTAKERKEKKNCATVPSCIILPRGRNYPRSSSLGGRRLAHGNGHPRHRGKGRHCRTRAPARENVQKRKTLTGGQRVAGHESTLTPLSSQGTFFFYPPVGFPGTQAHVRIEDAHSLGCSATRA